MSNNIIEGSICTDETINKLNFFQECFFYRLISNCENREKIDARPTILKAKLFPLKERVTLRDIKGALEMLSSCGCVELYELEQRPYLRIAACEAHLLTLRTQSNVSPSNNGKDIRPNVHRDAFQEFDEPLRAKLNEWIQYKDERLESCTGIALKNFIAEVKARRKQHSDSEICDLLTLCMSNSWKGVIWDKISTASKSKVCDTAGSSIDKDALDAFIDGQFDT